MADKLYRSHSLEKSKNDNNEVVTSGSLTVWEDSPVSPFDVGDTFRPVNNGPALTVDKVSIKDSVVGELNGKPVRQWEITIEGSNESSSSEESQTHIRYNFHISADEKSGTMEVVNNGDNPSITLDIGDTFNVPGIGAVSCSNVRGSDDYDDNGTHVWTVIYEGSDAPNSGETLPETKYSLAIQKDSEGDIQKSGSMSVVNEGNAPSLDISVDSKFNVPGLGNVTCSKVSASDDYTDNGKHRWTITYEGFLDDNSSGDDDNPDETNENSKYSFSFEKDNSGNVVHSGSVEITASGNSPTISHSVGSKITLPGVGEVTCTKVSGSDSYSDTGKRKWTVVYEGSDKSQDTDTKYTFSIEKNSDGITVYSGSKEITSTEETPTISVSVGEKFSLPVIGELTCTRVHLSNSEADTWSILIEGSRTSNNSLPETETVISYELNGTTVRSVAGKFIALRRSTTSITKKSITVYTDTMDAVASPGSTYKGGIVTSENIVKETIKNNGVVTGSYYKHTLEVEA